MIEVVTIPTATAVDSYSLNFVFTGGPDDKDSQQAIANLQSNRVPFIQVNLSKPEHRLKFFNPPTPVLFKATCLGGIDFISDINTLKQTLGITDDSKDFYKEEGLWKSVRLGLSNEAPARLNSVNSDHHCYLHTHAQNLAFKRKEEGSHFHTTQFSHQQNTTSFRVRGQLWLPSGRSVKGLLIVTLKRFIFSPDTDDDIVMATGMLRYTLDVALTMIRNCHLLDESKEIITLSNETILQFDIQKPKTKNKGIFPRKARKESYAHELHYVIKSYNFIIDKKNSTEVLAKISQQHEKSIVTSLQNELNLDVFHQQQESESHTELEDYLTLLNHSDIFVNNDIRRLYKQLPSSIRFQNLTLLFSTNTLGGSMSTFYNCLRDRFPTLIAVKDNQGFVFGYFTMEPWNSYGHFGGTGMSFLWSLHPEKHVYPWTRLNDYFQRGDQTSIYMGSGTTNKQAHALSLASHYGLWIGKNFTKGSSDFCDTYFNRCLSSSEEFDVSVLEVWTFTMADPSD